MAQYTIYGGIIRGITKVGLVLVAGVDGVSGDIGTLQHGSEVPGSVDRQERSVEG